MGVPADISPVLPALTSPALVALAASGASRVPGGPITGLFSSFLRSERMAVFTPVSASDLTSWLSHYSLGEPLDLRGIASGIENTNYFLTTTQGEFVLTIFEKLTRDELPFYLDLMRHLAQHDIPVPNPVLRDDGQLFGMLHGKPASIVTRLNGAPELAPHAVHCAKVGDMLARSHLAGRDFTGEQPNLRSLDWWETVVPSLLSQVPADQAVLLDSELAHQRRFFRSAAYAELPGGACHCDLFRDNVLFLADPAGRTEHDTLGGFFDFYFAGNDKWLFDLAVTVNDWCVDLDTGCLDPARTAALLDAYQAIRPLTPGELSHWQDMLRAGAYRFWVSRLLDFHRPRAAELLQPHDPGRFERTLRDRIATVPRAPLAESSVPSRAPN
jgi:homoserine kinase type II